MVLPSHITLASHFVKIGVVREFLINVLRCLGVGTFILRNQTFKYVSLCRARSCVAQASPKFSVAEDDLQLIRLPRAGMSSGNLIPGIHFVNI